MYVPLRFGVPVILSTVLVFAGAGPAAAERPGEAVRGWGDQGSVVLFENPPSAPSAVGTVDEVVDLDVTPRGRPLASAWTNARGGFQATFKEYAKNGEPATWRFGKKGVSGLFSGLLWYFDTTIRDPVKVANDGRIWLNDGRNVYRLTDRGAADASFTNSWGGSVPGRAGGYLEGSDEMALLPDGSVARTGQYGDADWVYEQHSSSGAQAVHVRWDLFDRCHLGQVGLCAPGTSDSAPAPAGARVWLSSLGAWRFAADLELDTTFGDDGTVVEPGVALAELESTADGYVISGSRGGSTVLFAITADGRRDPAFGKAAETTIPRGNPEVLRVRPNGSLVVAGNDPASGPWVASVLGNGRLDRAFNRTGILDAVPGGVLGAGPNETRTHLFSAELFEGDLLVGLSAVKYGIPNGSVRMTRLELGWS